MRLFDSLTSLLRSVRHHLQQSTKIIIFERQTKAGSSILAVNCCKMANPKILGRSPERSRPIITFKKQAYLSDRTKPSGFDILKAVFKIADFEIYASGIDSFLPTRQVRELATKK